MLVYLLHLSKPLEHTQHYIGWAEHFEERMAHHRGGTGARYTQVAVERGIDLVVARVWEDQDRHFERRLKNYKNARLLCPICNPGRAKNRMKK